MLTSCVSSHHADWLVPASEEFEMLAKMAGRYIYRKKDRFKKPFLRRNVIIPREAKTPSYLWTAREQSRGFSAGLT